MRSPIHLRCLGLRIVAGLLGCALFLPVCPQLAAAPPEAIRDAIESLGHTDFPTRTAAERQLRAIATEEDITDPLETFALQAKAPEVARRAVRVLEWVFLSQPGPRADAAEAALERLALSDSAASVPATETLRGSARLRESRACAAIEKLGGAVVYVDPHATPVLRNQAVAPTTGVGFGPPSVLHYVWLHDNWKGGVEGLWHLGRLSHLAGLRVYNIRGNGLDTLAVRKAASNVPGLDVIERGRACLGITDAAQSNGPCMIGSVLRGGAAERAGLEREDVILQVDGQPVDSFNHLVQMLEDMAPDEEIAVDIERRGMPLTIKVKLTRWQDIQARTPDSVPPPPRFEGPLATKPAPEPPAATDADETTTSPKTQVGAVPTEAPADGNGK